MRGSGGTTGLRLFLLPDLSVRGGSNGGPHPQHQRMAVLEVLA